MSESVMYNQEVTADMLNDIAIDLGATSFSKFADGEPYAVNELNEITSALVGKGVLLTGERCRVTYNDGMICVADGVIVFENGAKIKLFEPQTFTALDGTSYVYALNDTTNNIAKLVCSAEEPDGSADHVMLAKVEGDMVTGLRNTCKLKTDAYFLNQNEDLDDFDFEVTKEESEDEWVLKKILECNISSFVFFKFSYVFDTPYTNTGENGEVFADLTNDEAEVSVYSSGECMIKIVKDLNKIYIYSNWTNADYSYCKVYFSNVKVL